MIHRNRQRLPKMNAAEATKTICQIARMDDCDFTWRLHAKERLHDRGLIFGDILHVLKNGRVYGSVQKASRGYFKYRMRAYTPNSKREVAVVVIPDFGHLKILTVMWVDDHS